MYYIRFLRTPRVDIVQKSSLEVSAVVAITTDLGDAFLLHDIELLIHLVSTDKPSSTIVITTSAWNNGARVAKLALRLSKVISNKKVVLHITTKETAAAQASNSVPKVLDVWSTEFILEPGARSEPLVDRRFHLSPSIFVRSREETGDSIARHIWDAALGSLICFQDNLIHQTPTLTKLPQLKALLSKKVRGGLSILELGAGCGVVGITLAQIIPCQVLLTDLDDAQVMLDLNIKHAKLAPNSNCRRGVLDWASPLETNLLPDEIDVLIVADCIYNTDSIPPLVKTMKEVFGHSRDCKVFIARKPRHDSEIIFFKLIEEAGAALIEKFTMSLPHLETEMGTPAPEVEFYLYGLP